MPKTQYRKMYERLYRNYRKRGYTVLEAHCEALFDTSTFYNLNSRLAELLRNDVLPFFTQNERQEQREAL